MPSPRLGTDTSQPHVKPRRASAATSVALMVLAGSTALIGIAVGLGDWTEEARSKGFVAGEPEILEAHLAFKDPVEMWGDIMKIEPGAGSDPIYADVLPPPIIPNSNTWLPGENSASGKPPPFFLLQITYPNQVDIGDSIKLTVDLSSAYMPSIEKGDVIVLVSSGALEWSGQEMKRTIAKGSTLPARVYFTPSAKDTGRASILVEAEAPNPIQIVTSAGEAAVPGGPASGTSGGAADSSILSIAPVDKTDSMKPRLKPDAAISPEILKLTQVNLRANDTVDVMVLTKWHISDRYVHWFTTVGWIISAISAAAIGKFGLDLWRKMRNKDQPPSPPPDLGGAYT